MRHRNTAGLVLALGGFALLGVRDDIGATGSIDVSGATVTIGDAPAAGAVIVDDAASLGTVPHLDGALLPEWAMFFSIFEGALDSVVHTGLGGADFRARTDLSMPGGTYDFGSFTVDRGAVVRFTGPVTVRALDFIQIDGRIEMEGAGGLTLDCAGDVTILGHDEEDVTGVVALDDGAQVTLSVGGVLSVGADEGARVELAAKSEVRIACDSDEDRVIASISRADISASAGGKIVLHTQRGRIELTECRISGPVPRVLAPGYIHEIDGSDEGVEWVPFVQLRVSGGEFSGLIARMRGDVRIEDGARIETGLASLYGASVDIHTPGGSVTLDDESSIVVSHTVRIGCNGLDGVRIGEGCEIRVAGEGASGDLVLVSGQGLSIGDAAVVANESGGGTYVSGATGVEVLGTVRGRGESVEFTSSMGDVSIGGAAVVEAPNGVLRLFSAGAVTAEDGEGALVARDFDVRCVTGDLDLDVETLVATVGNIVAMSNGTVRLRGSYEAAGSIQVLSLLDSVDVAGATLATADTDASPSGFLRLATYAATSIDASNATLVTGDSDAQSGDVLIQVEAEGTEVVEGTMSVQRAQMKRMPDGVHTVISGTMSIAGLGSAQLAGTARVHVGGASHRVFLSGGKSKFRGERPGVSLRIARTGKTRAKFVLDLKESVTKDPGTIEEVRFVRAGMRANGKFRRPKAKN